MAFDEKSWHLLVKNQSVHTSKYAPPDFSPKGAQAFPSRCTRLMHPLG